MIARSESWMLDGYQQRAVGYRRIFEFGMKVDGCPQITEKQLKNGQPRSKDLAWVYMHPKKRGRLEA